MFDGNYEEVVIAGKTYYLHSGMLYIMKNLHNGSFDYALVTPRELASIILAQNTTILESEC